MQKFNVDFSGTEESKEFEVIQPGRYKVTIDSVESKPGSEYPYLEWQLKISEGKYKGLRIRHITSLSPSALFGLRDLLTAIGIKVPKSAVTIDPDKYIGQPLVVETFIKPHNGKDYANVKSVHPATTATSTPQVSTTSHASSGADIDLDDDELVF